MPKNFLETSGYTDFASDFETLSSATAQYIFQLNRNLEEQATKASTEIRIAELQIRANLATLASQLHFNPRHIERTVTGISGNNILEIQLKEQLGDAESYWTGVRDLAGILIGDLSQEGRSATDSISAIAKIGQEAQERVFFFRGALTIEETEKGYLRNIALGLESASSIASDFYLNISG